MITDHHSSPLITTHHHSSPLITTHHHSSPPIATHRHPSPLMTMDCSTKEILTWSEMPHDLPSLSLYRNGGYRCSSHAQSYLLSFCRHGHLYLSAPKGLDAPCTLIRLGRTSG
jgi:hypothetical protein